MSYIILLQSLHSEFKFILPGLIKGNANQVAGLVQSTNFFSLQFVAFTYVRNNCYEDECDRWHNWIDLGKWSLVVFGSISLHAEFKILLK